MEERANGKRQGAAKKEAARLLYMEGYSQTDIGKILNVGPKSLSSWQKEGDWAGRRTMRALHQQTNREAIEELAAYQLQALLALKNKYVEEGNMKLIDKGEFDALAKAFSTIKTDEIKWEEIVRILRRFTAFIESRDLEVAKRVIEFADIYINEVRREML